MRGLCRRALFTTHAQQARKSPQKCEVSWIAVRPIPFNADHACARAEMPTPQHVYALALFDHRTFHPNTDATTQDCHGNPNAILASRLRVHASRPVYLPKATRTFSPVTSCGQVAIRSVAGVAAVIMRTRCISHSLTVAANPPNPTTS